MTTKDFKKIYNFDDLTSNHIAFIEKVNSPVTENNGIYSRYKNPVVTAQHVPLHWRYDFNAETNPLGLERIGFNATFNAGAMKFNNKYILCLRVEGNDRKSFLLLLKVQMELIIFNFGINLVLFHKLKEIPTRMHMTCD